MPEATTFAAAFVIGLLGSSHCLAMCGGIVGALSLALPAAQRRGWPLFAYTLAYNGGRIASYVLAGALVGALGYSLTLGGQAQAVNTGLRLVAAVFLVLMGFYLAAWWPVLTHLERWGAGLWRAIRPWNQRLMPLDRPWKALAAGALWGWLPCGLTYSALGWSLAAGNPADGATLMLGFGLGTLPAMLALGTLAERLRDFTRRPATRQVAALLLIGLGLWTGAQALAPEHQHGAARAHATEHQHPQAPAPAQGKHEHHH